jgi:aryl-alcohol dehydrogenase-like predicted oxidoreductase
LKLFLSRDALGLERPILGGFDWGGNASCVTAALAPSPTPHVLRTGNNRKNMVRSIEASLKRLKTDRIDLYWVHMDDGVTRMEEIVRGLDDLVRAGKILYVGLSDFPAWRVARPGRSPSCAAGRPSSGCKSNTAWPSGHRTGNYCP